SARKSIFCYESLGGAGIPTTQGAIRVFYLPTLILALNALGAVSVDAAEAEMSVDIGVHELRAHVYRLASPEFLGRRGAGAARTARHLAAAFERLGLKPAFAGSYAQPIPWLVKDSADSRDSFVGRNIGAVLPGQDPALKEEWVILCAHYDHLGQR